MRILICTQKVDTTDPVLGFFHRWIIECAKHFDQITVVCLEEGTHALPQTVKVFSLGKEKGGSKFMYLIRFYRYLWSLRHDYDAVFVHMNQIYVLLGGLFWKLSKKRVFLWYTHKSVTWSLRVATHLVDRVLTASVESFRIASPKVVVLGHGIDTEMFAPRERTHKEVSIMTIGRLSKVKKQDVLIEACAELRPGVPIRLDIVGAPVTPEDRGYAESLRDQVQRLGIDHMVHFRGPVSHNEVPELLASAHIFVNLSDTGSLDKAVLEAMACGIPVVTSNEAFRPMLSVFGLFCDSSVHAVATTLGSLLGRRDQLGEMGRELRSIVTRDHDLSRLIRTIASLYSS